MKQISEETANKLADAFIEHMKVSKESSFIFSDLESSYRLIVKKSMVNKIITIIESYFEFKWQYPFNRLKMILCQKKALKELDKLMKDKIEISKLLT